MEYTVPRAQGLGDCLLLKHVTAMPYVIYTVHGAVVSKRTRLVASVSFRNFVKCVASSPAFPAFSAATEKAGNPGDKASKCVVL